MRTGGGIASPTNLLLDLRWAYYVSGFFIQGRLPLNEQEDGISERPILSSMLAHVRVNGLCFLLVLCAKQSFVSHTSPQEDFHS